MNPHLAICLMSLASLASCKENPKPATDVMSQESGPPGAERAARAAANVRPALERDLAAANLRFGDPVFIRAYKEEKQLDLYVLNRVTQKFERFRTYPIAGTSGNPGPKLAEGDGQVPEGFYFVAPAAMNPASRFHLAFNIGYPNAFDLAHRRTGSAIMIHGGRLSIGCLAMTDEKIEEIYTLCDAAHHGGQAFFRVHLFPSRLTDEWMAKAVGSPNEEFWKNLKDGYDRFEESHVPPDVSVLDGRYRFQ